MGLFSPLTSVIKTIIDVVAGRGGSIGDIMYRFIKYLPDLLASVTKVIDMKNSNGQLSTLEIKVLIDDAMSEFDSLTGVEGMSFIPKDKRNAVVEEQALDDFVKFMTGMLYMLYSIVPADLKETETSTN